MLHPNAETKAGYAPASPTYWF